MQISKKGRGVVAVVRSRQVVAVHESSDRFFQWTVSRDRCLWTVERGGRCIQVVVKTGFTVYTSINGHRYNAPYRRI